MIEFETLDDGLEAVRKGQIFGYIDKLITSGYAIQKKYMGELKMACKVKESCELSVEVSDDDSILLSMFEKTILSREEKESIEIMNECSGRHRQGTGTSLQACSSIRTRHRTGTYTQPPGYDLSPQLAHARDPLSRTADAHYFQIGLYILILQCTLLSKSA